jgi:hypothetical protein
LAGVFISKSLRYTMAACNQMTWGKLKPSSLMFSIGWLDSSVGRAED